ncbi:NAD(P)-binding protein [Terfezia boudieri ATCC MYA-4762]|uniref:NAD(P)-binding protein n=1 Tax=Terfezia boudieri ATCC MYA-4762 TaxID=1051890 RepID=A0A3N4LLI0_9PEZI|nr:NAD(P)-binding protein [Terfezia boudieri ATCC MYA-4762]
MVHNKSLIFANIPTGYPVPGQDLVVKESDLDLNSVPEGSVALKNFYVSLDPYQRSRMRPANIKSYSPAFQLNSVVTNKGISEVVKSNNPDFKIGELVVGHVGTENYSVVPKERLAGFVKVDNKHNLPLSYFVGALGMPGLTAYSSFYEIGRPKEGETIFISAASGAVGQLVGQIAKREGLKVIGSVGSDEKVDFIKNELKFDEAFNYKTISNHDALKKLAPNGIDIYFENVGGEALEAALDAANLHARFIMCGMISYYNVKSKDEMYLPSNIMDIVWKRIKLQGFIVDDPDFTKYAEEHRENVSRWLRYGEIVVKETVSEGVGDAAAGFVGMLKGQNLGKGKVEHYSG